MGYVTVIESERFYITVCANCGVRFGMSEKLETERRQDGGRFHCPNGHFLTFGESAADKLRRERDRLQQEIARLKEEAAEAWQAESKARDRVQRAESRVKKLAKRAAAGTCPSCRRTFQDMATHMKRQHPEFVEDSGAKVVPIKVTK